MLLLVQVLLLLALVVLLLCPVCVVGQSRPACCTCGCAAHTGAPATREGRARCGSMASALVRRDCVRAAAAAAVLPVRRGWRSRHAAGGACVVRVEVLDSVGLLLPHVMPTAVVMRRPRQLAAAWWPRALLLLQVQLVAAVVVAVRHVASHHTPAVLPEANAARQHVAVAHCCRGRRCCRVDSAPGAHRPALPPPTVHRRMWRRRPLHAAAAEGTSRQGARCCACACCAACGALCAS
jgi:hypothetical protein